LRLASVSNCVLSAWSIPCLRCSGVSCSAG
jgi:hypothetical protein